MTHQRKILLVDDEVDHLDLFTMFLRKHGFDVYSISDPNEIWGVLKNFKPEVIILDVRIGIHDGKEICRQLKNNPETKGIKVILHSAFPQVADEYHLCGADEFILKPTNISHLIDRLNFYLP